MKLTTFSQAQALLAIIHLMSTNFVQSFFFLINCINYTSAPLSNNSAESNPFGNEDEEESEEPNVVGSQNCTDVEKPVYLNVRVKALYDYKSADEDELSFKAGKDTFNIFLNFL